MLGAALFDFGGKDVLVTGGATSLGASISKAFHAAGAKVWIADIDLDSGHALAASLNTLSGTRCVFVRTDIRNDVDIDECAALIRKTSGKLDVLVNNACIYLDQGINSERETWAASFDVNVFGGARMVRSLLPSLISAKEASVVNLSSIAGKIGQRERAIYPACKAAILQLTRNQACDLAQHGIRVNAITPAWTWSKALERQSGTRAVADSIGAKVHPLGRVGDAQDVANAALFLSSSAASFVTGIDLPVDGGFSVLGPDQGRPSREWWT